MTDTTDKKKKGKTILVDNNPKLFYFSVLVGDPLYEPQRELDWYALDPNAPSFEKVADMSAQLPRDFGCAVLNSTIYVIGGQYPPIDGFEPEGSPLNQVQIFDTTNTREWVTLSESMISPRVSPLVIPLPDKQLIYVFGSGDEYQQISVTPWAECYNPLKNQWEKLHDPPGDIIKWRYLSGSAVSAAGAGHHRIILWNQHLFLLFDTDQNKWLQTVDAPREYVPRILYSNRVAVIGETLFWYYYGYVFSYQLGDDKGCDGRHAYSFQTNSDPPSERDSPYLIATDKEELCLVWYRHRFSEEPMCVSFTKFQVNRSPTGVLLDEVCKRTFDVEGIHIYQFAEDVQWKNEYKGEHDFVRDSPQTSKPLVGDIYLQLIPLAVDHMDLLENLSCTMHNMNFYAYWKNEIEMDSVDVPADGIVQVDLPHIKPKEEISVEFFLQSVGVDEKYLKIFEDNKFDMKTLKATNVKGLKNLNIPMGPRKKLLVGMRLMMRKEAARASVVQWNGKKIVH